MESCVTRSYNVLKFLNCEKYLFVKKQNKTKQNKNKNEKTHPQKTHNIMASGC